MIVPTFVWGGGKDRELNSSWRCTPIRNIKVGGKILSKPDFNIKSWKPAIVPGTVLTTKLANKEISDPFYGLNNKKIKDIYDTGRNYYTYWFINDFQQKKQQGKQVWLHFRGVNYSCNIFLNGKKVNKKRHYGMFLRQCYNITDLLSKNGKNRLAVIVYPVDPVGNPNGGQGGDGEIARNVSNQYVAGWDWIQPIRDRNTGIWDKVTIETTGDVNIQNPHVVTIVSGVRFPDKKQDPAIIKTSSELVNASQSPLNGKLIVEINGQKIEKNVTLNANETRKVVMPELVIKTPKLWWPNGYGKQNLYVMNFRFVTDNKVSDNEAVSVGIREIRHKWNTRTRSMQVSINGQKIFIKGGNWIISDAMLRFSPERYDAEIRYHRDMNLNLIRVWGGSIPERPEFYTACNKYGLLVIQDFAMSGDCNGRWVDPMKKEDQWTRHKYPEDHNLFINSSADIVRMIRNNPSLAIWCGGNEITPPQDILTSLQDSILPYLDGTRWFIPYSNSDSMSYNFIGNNGDGPYGIQPDSIFWQHRTWPFNSEVGSVGLGDIVSLKRFLPKEDLVAPIEKEGKEAVDNEDWTFHKYIGYGHSIDAYGKVKGVEDFTRKAQLVNYNQYRALMEGFSSHMWDWYTGSIIWKTQNPWTAMRGQMYDYYLDPNACLYGLHNGSEPLHVMCNPVTKMVSVINNRFSKQDNLMMVAKAYDIKGNEEFITQVIIYMNASSVKPIMNVNSYLKKAGMDTDGVFLLLQLKDMNKKVLSENLYWFPNDEGRYSGLNKMMSSRLEVTACRCDDHKVKVTLKNPQGAPVAFFNRLSLMDTQTNKRILPVFADNNYVSLVPGTEKTIELESQKPLSSGISVTIEGWNMKKTTIKVM